MATSNVLKAIIEFIDAQLDKIQEETDRTKSFAISINALTSVVAMCAGAMHANVKEEQDDSNENEKIIYNEDNK